MSTSRPGNGSNASAPDPDAASAEEKLAAEKVDEGVATETDDVESGAAGRTEIQAGSQTESQTGGEAESRAERRAARRAAKREAREERAAGKRARRKRAAGRSTQESPETIFDDTAASTPAPPPAPAPAPQGFWATWMPLLLIRTAHPRQALLTAIGMTVAALLAGREGGGLALVFATVLVGQAVLGWHNDLVDEPVDRAHARSGKPIADGRLDPGTVWFILCCAVLLVIPLAVSNGIIAGVAYLASVAIGILANVVLRRGLLSFVPWALAFATYPFFLAYGGLGSDTTGNPPQPLMVVLAALLGVGAHFLTALWGLVADHEDRWTYLPLKLGLRMGATRLLVLTLLYCALVIAGLLLVGHSLGLTT